MAAIKSTKVPKAFGEIYAVITTITDTFCRERLNEEYGELARVATAALCRKRPSPLSRGQPKTWACGVHSTAPYGAMIASNNCHTDRALFVLLC